MGILEQMRFSENETSNNYYYYRHKSMNILIVIDKRIIKDEDRIMDSYPILAENKYFQAVERIERFNETGYFISIEIRKVRMSPHYDEIPVSDVKFIYSKSNMVESKNAHIARKKCYNIITGNEGIEINSDTCRKQALPKVRTSPNFPTDRRLFSNTIALQKVEDYIKEVAIPSECFENRGGYMFMIEGYEKKLGFKHFFFNKHTELVSSDFATIYSVDIEGMRSLMKEKNIFRKG